MANTIKLTWGASEGAIEYRIYHGTSPGLSIAHSTLLATVNELTFEHTGLIPNSLHYYIVVAAGPNGELSPPSNEIGQTTSVLISITVTPSNLHIVTMNLQQYTAIGHYSDSSTSDITGIVTWDTVNHAFATINSFGILSAVSIGTTNVTATFGAITGSTNVVVIALVSIAVTPATLTISVGDTQQMVATGTYNDASTQILTSSVIWSNIGSAITISLGGLVTALTIGSATIVATLGLVNGNTGITINAPVIVLVTPAHYTLELSLQQQFTATSYFAYISAAPTWNAALDTVIAFGISADFSSIFAFNDSKIWAACFSGTKIYHYNGTSWAQQTLSVNNCNILQVYGWDEFNIIAADSGNGNGSGILRTTDGGFSWESVDSFDIDGNNTESCSGIHGTFSNNLWAIFQNTTSTSYVAQSVDGGATWIDMLCPISDTAFFANHIWVNSPTDVWLGDYNGSVYYWNGTVWNTTTLPSGQSTDGIWGTSYNNMFFGTWNAGANGIVHWNGTIFTQVYTGPNGGGDDYWTITGLGADVWAGSFSANEVAHSTDGGDVFNNTDGYGSGTFAAVGQSTTKIWLASDSGIILSAPTSHVTSNITNTSNWISSVPGAASINAGNGLATSVGVGLTTITATHGPINGSTALLIAILPQLVSIEISIGISTATTAQFIATGTYDDASTRGLTPFVTWASTNMSIGTINTNGLFTFVSVGSTNITAELDGYSDLMPITVIYVWGSESTVSANYLGGYAVSATNLFINNSYVSPSRVFKSDGTGTWTNTLLGLGSSPVNTESVWGSGSIVLIGGQGGSTSNAIIRSTNGGSTWATVSNSFTSNVWFIHGSSVSNIWAAGGFNVLLRSTDSGATWSSVSFGSGFLNGIAAIGSSDVWIGGSNNSFTTGILAHYNGSSFTNYYTALNNSDVIVNSIWAVSSSEIYLIGSSTDFTKKYIYHTTDSGSNFTLEYKIFDTTTNGRPKIFVVSPTNVYAATSATEILHTTGDGYWTREIAAFPFGTGNTNITALLGTADNNLFAAGEIQFVQSFILKKDKHFGLLPVLLSISVTGASSISSTAQYRATGTYEDGRTIDITADVTWASTNTGVATISNIMTTIGLATKTGNGSTNITATLGLITGILPVTGV